MLDEMRRNWMGAVSLMLATGIRRFGFLPIKRHGTSITMKVDL